MTPAAGQWVARGPDPYGFELFSDGSHLSGQGCLGALPREGDGSSCSPLALQADRGRRVAFVWDTNQAKDATGFVYVVKMELTLAPERTAMAGKVWTSLGPVDGEGLDIVLVRYPEQPVPPATVCSGGEPSGACFLAPLRSDRLAELRVVKLGGDNLLLLWKNQRGVGSRIASAQFDAAAGAWQGAEFLDDGSGPVDFPLLAASPKGWAVLAYEQNNALVTRAYDPTLNAWSEQQALVVSDDSSASPRAEALLVYDGGDATLIASSLAQDGSSALSAHDYVAKTGLWEDPHLLAASPDVAAYQWAAASDSARNELVVWADGGSMGEADHVWFSSRSAAGAWTAPAPFHTSDKQILHPAAAIGPDGSALVTWQEFLGRIASASYSFETGAWSEPLTVTAEPDIDNRRVAFSEANSPVAYFRRNSALNGDAEQKTELANGAWTAPQTTTVAEAEGANYSVTGGMDDLQITPLYPSAGETTPPPLSRPRCDGYPTVVHLSASDNGRDVRLPLHQELELTLQTIGPGQFGDPVISYPSVTFDGVTLPKVQNPGGPTQIFRFRTVAEGTALITIPHDSGREPFTLALRCCAP